MGPAVVLAGLGTRVGGVVPGLGLVVALVVGVLRDALAERVPLVDVRAVLVGERGRVQVALGGAGLGRIQHGLVVVARGGASLLPHAAPERPAVAVLVTLRL